MSEQTNADHVENVAPGDVVTLDHGERTGTYRVVHVDAGDPNYLLTLETDGGETFDLELPAQATVTRTLESKWESPQSPTPHSGD